MPGFYSRRKRQAAHYARDFAASRSDNRKLEVSNADAAFIVGDLDRYPVMPRRELSVVGGYPGRTEFRVRNYSAGYIQSQRAVCDPKAVQIDCRASMGMKAGANGDRRFYRFRRVGLLYRNRRR